MNRVVIDTNPLIYIYNGIPDYGKRYAILLGELLKNHFLTIPKIVYGEFSLEFCDKAELDVFLNDTGIIVSELSSDAYFSAARRWQTYLKRRTFTCQKCGNKLSDIICTNCMSTIKIRQHILTDFLVGAFALETGKTIVTNDSGYYSTYFPELKIITA